MTFTRLHDILDHVKQTHYQAAEYFAQMGDLADERLRLFMDLFRQREDHLGHWLDALEREQGEVYLDTWIQFAPTEAMDDALATLLRAQHDPPDVLVYKSFCLQEEILKLLEHLADSLDAPDVRHRLLDLAALERKAARDLGVADIMQRDS